MGLMPLALVAHPSVLSMPVDVALGVMFPVHMHIGMGYVITDYAPKFFGKGSVMPIRYIQLVLTGITFLGLAKLNFAGPGLTGSVKALWNPKKKE
jgi:succinate dehydrogenase (ubiquinone) membrane anchor subunit